MGENRHFHLESEVVAIGRNKEGSGGGGCETTAITTTIKFSPLFLPSCSIYFSGNRGPSVRQIAALLFFSSTAPEVEPNLKWIALYHEAPNKSHSFLSHSVISREVLSRHSPGELNSIHQRTQSRLLINNFILAPPEFTQQRRGTRERNREKGSKD